MATKISYQPLVYILVIWFLFMVSLPMYSQDCGCIECPLPILDQNISTATYVVDGAQNNALASNLVNTVFLKFKHSYPSELGMKLISPAGQAVILIGAQGTQNSSTFFGGFNIRFVADIADTDPDSGMSNSWDNADLSGLNQYNGAYLPYSGALQNFNTGTVNGQWTLEITDPLQLDSGILEEFVIRFDDQEGIDCCQADGGIVGGSPIIACPGADTLLLSDLEPMFIGSAPNSALFGYTYVITESDVILELNQVPDLRSYGPGDYAVYGFSYDLDDIDLLPDPNDIFTIDDLQTLLSGAGPLLCGNTSESFLPITIQDGDTETYLRDTICQGQSIPFGNEIISMSGEYRDTFSVSESCDSIVILNLWIAATDTTFTTRQTCTAEEVGSDTMYLTNIFSCDSIVITQLLLQPSDTVYLIEETCIIEQDSQMDTLVLSTSLCDSVYITTFFYEDPDTMFTLNKTCDPSQVGLDTITLSIDQECEEYEIIETVLYFIDTSYFVSTSCDFSEVGETIELVFTDSCDRVEVTTILFAAADTTRIDLFSCDTEGIGVDTLLLSNQNECDSLIITTTDFSEADTLYLFELTCDTNQLESTIESFSTATCDSIVITTYEFLFPDTTYIEVLSCEENTQSDTSFFQNALGCDSIVITTYDFSESALTLLSFTTCDPSQSGIFSDTLQGVFCDSIIRTSIELILGDTTLITAFTCDAVQIENDTLILSNENGCDSLVIQEYIFSDTATIRLDNIFTCELDQVGVDTMTLISSQGCDSLLIQEYVFSEADTIFLEPTFTCDPDLVGVDTLIVETSICDSVMISPTILEGIDTTMLSLTSCDILTVLFDTIYLTSAQGCDSIILMTTLPITSSQVIIQIPVQDPTLVGLDTLVLTNAVGCDSLVITDSFLDSNPQDTIRLELFTCDLGAVIDTSISATGVVTITLPIPIIVDTTFLQATTCDVDQPAVEMIQIPSYLGCDSIVVTNFSFNDIDTNYVFLDTCEDVPQDTIMVSTSECPTLQITTYNNLSSEIVYTELVNCVGPFGVDTLYLLNSLGCDSTIIQTTIEALSSVTILQELTCFPSLPNDTLMLEGQTCDSLVITTYIYQELPPGIININTCNSFDLEPDTIIISSSMGCDSTVIIEKTLVSDTITFLTFTTCDELLIGEIRDTLNSISGCDSIIVTEYVASFFASDYTLEVSPPYCAGDADGEATILLDSDIEVTWVFDSFIGSSRTDLLEGVYDLILSQGACDTTIQLTIPAGLSPEIDFQLDYVLCSSTGGVVEVQISGGTSPYDLLWEDGSQDAMRNDLTNGVYFLTVTDARGCMSQDSIEILNVTGLEFSADIDHLTCYESADGAIAITLLSGTAPYEVLWEDGSTDLIRTSLSEGIYSCTINDANDCNLVLNRVVLQPDTITLSIEEDEAGGCEVMVTGGTPPYEYLWNDGTTGPVILNPVSGFVYEVTITDANDCLASMEKLPTNNSVSFFDDASISVYPNPSQAGFNFTYDTHLSLQELIIYNIHGKAIYELSGNNLASSSYLQIPTQTAGTYILKAHFTEGVYVQKIIHF